MTVQKKVSNHYTTIRLSKRAYIVLQTYQKLVQMKTSKELKPEKIELTMDRIMLDRIEGYPRFVKPLRRMPMPTIRRFAIS